MISSHKNTHAGEQNTFSFTTSIIKCTQTNGLRYWAYNSDYNETCNYKLKKEDYLNGLTYNQILHHIGVNQKEALHKMVGLNNNNTQKCINDIKESLVNDDSVTYSPILINEHWCVAIISKKEINIFDSTLQTNKLATN